MYLKDQPCFSMKAYVLVSTEYANREQHIFHMLAGFQLLETKMSGILRGFFFFASFVSKADTHNTWNSDWMPYFDTSRIFKSTTEKYLILYYMFCKHISFNFLLYCYISCSSNNLLGDNELTKI